MTGSNKVLREAYQSEWWVWHMILTEAPVSVPLDWLLESWLPSSLAPLASLVLCEQTTCALSSPRCWLLMATRQTLLVAVHGPALPSCFIISALHKTHLGTVLEPPSSTTNTHTGSWWWSLTWSTRKRGTKPWAIYVESLHNHLANCRRGQKKTSNSEVEKNCCLKCSGH